MPIRVEAVLSRVPPSESSGSERASTEADRNSEDGLSLAASDNDSLRLSELASKLGRRYAKLSIQAVP